MKQKNNKMKQKRDCAFQYAKINKLKEIIIVEDKTKLTLDEAKQLWNKYYEDAAKWIKNGNTLEMGIWVNMSTPHSYVELLQYIPTDAESDGVSIWETKRLYFKKYDDVVKST